jgi:tetratricopeptide (TPR) repeat protein
MTMMRKISSLTIAILILCAASFTQEKISPLSDWQYSKKDYPQYEIIKKETDAQKKCDSLLGFLKDRPISRMLIYIVTDYMDCVKPVLEKKDFAKAISMEEGLWALLPTEKTIKEAGIPAGAEGPAGEEEFRKTQFLPAQALIQGKLYEAYYGSNNWPKAAETAEKIYASSSNKSMIPALADIYLKIPNHDKYLDYAKKILEEFPMEQAYQTAIQMAQIYFQKQNVGAAIDLYTKIENAFGDKLPPNVTEAQYNAIKALVYSSKADLYTKIENASGDKTPPNVTEAQYNTLRAFVYLNKANEIYNKKDYPKAQELYEKITKVDPKNDVAYYQIAMCKWKNNDSEGAIEPFAKCVVLNNKITAPKAQSYLEQIYKARHSDSTEGLDGVLAKAKADLGIK